MLMVTYDCLSKWCAQLENIICFGYCADLLLSLSDLEVNCHREYENGFCDISFLWVFFHETSPTVYGLTLPGRTNCDSKCLRWICVKMFSFFFKTVWLNVVNFNLLILSLHGLSVPWLVLEWTGAVQGNCSKYIENTKCWHYVCTK